MNMFGSRFNLLILLLLQPRQLLLQPTHHTEPEFSSPTESTIVANSTPEGIQEATVAVEQSYQPVTSEEATCTIASNPQPSKCFDLMFLLA